MKVVDIKNDDVFGTVYKFEHTADPINGIDGKMFHDFSELCPFDMQKIDDEVCLALSEIELTKYPTVNGVSPPKEKEAKPHIVFEHEALYDYQGDKEIFKNMTPMQRRKFMFFKKQITLPWFFILDLKPNLFKTRQLDLQEWNDISEKFPYLRQCIEQMPFEQIGRVVIYGSWPGADVPCHRDDLPSKEFGHHINFNPGGYRPAYIYDADTGEKHYLPSDHKFYAFNTTDYHGVDSMPVFTYTIRVDGIYDKYKINF
jgi:hypothetical protein